MNPQVNALKKLPGMAPPQANSPTLGNSPQHPMMNNPHLIPLLHLLQLHLLAQGLAPKKRNDMNGGPSPTQQPVSQAPPPQVQLQ